LSTKKHICGGFYGKNWAFKNYIFIHNRICLLFWNPFLVDIHLHCRFATIFPLLRRKNLKVYVAFAMKMKKSYLFILWRKSLKIKYYRRRHRQEFLLNVILKQFMNGISVPAEWSLLVFAINCTPLFNITVTSELFPCPCHLLHLDSCWNSDMFLVSFV